MMFENSDEPRELTEDEVREIFINHLTFLARYWSNISERTSYEMCLGMLHSVLVTIDGCSELPSFDLVCRPHPEDKEFHKNEGTNWYPDGLDINNGGLHGSLYWRPDGSKRPEAKTLEKIIPYKISIVIEKDKDKDNENEFVAFSPFFGISASSYDETNALNFVKGSCLSAISYFENVPNVIEFEICDKTL